MGFGRGQGQRWAVVGKVGVMKGKVREVGKGHEADTILRGIVLEDMRQGQVGRGGGGARVWG